MTGAALFTVAGTNLGNGNLWYDEAGQYWISLGQNHAAPLLSPEGSLWDVWQVGKKFNSDPGGYTLIMRAIIKLFGSGPAYLHMCSFVFFILGIAATYLLAREARLSPLVAAAISTIPFINDQAQDFAFETCFFSAKRSLSSMSERRVHFFGDFSCFKFWLHSKSDMLLGAPNCWPA
jgi:hypothetical protein